MFFRQFFDRDTCTYSYLLADRSERKAVLVDPVREHVDRDVQAVSELGFELLFLLETHVHADHVTGAAELALRTGARTAIGSASGARADVLLADGDRVEFGRHALTVLATPGHTAGCVSYVTDDQAMVFTGDALLVRGCGRTDFQEGDAQTLYRSIHQKIFRLPDACVVYPGHDYHGRTASSVGEERAWNPRLGGGRSEDDFVGIMAALRLDPPQRIETAVPANLRGGRVHA